MRRAPYHRAPSARLVVTCAIVLAAAATVTEGGAAPEHVHTDTELLSHVLPVVVLAEVVAYHEPLTQTNGAPPAVHLHVVRTLKGDVGELPAVKGAVWLPYPHEIDTTGRDAHHRYAAWATQPNQAPGMRTRWILAGYVQDGWIMVSARCRYPYSEEKLEWTERVLRETKPLVKIDVPDPAEVFEAWAQAIADGEIDKAVGLTHAAAVSDPSDLVNRYELLKMRTRWAQRPTPLGHDVDGDVAVVHFCDGFDEDGEARIMVAFMVSTHHEWKLLPMFGRLGTHLEYLTDTQNRRYSGLRQAWFDTRDELPEVYRDAIEALRP